MTAHEAKAKLEAWFPRFVEGRFVLAVTPVKREPFAVEIAKGPQRRKAPQIIAKSIDDCWKWTLKIDTKGYGRINVHSLDNRITIGGVMAHRIYHQFFNGPIPPGYQVDHLCRVTQCVNPNHLEAVTPAENIRRSSSVSVLNARKTHCPSGHFYGHENLIIRQGPYGKKRICRACFRRDNLAYYHRNKEAINDRRRSS